MSFLPTKPIVFATHDPKVAKAIVSIRPSDLLRSVYVIGKTGTGKSALLLHLLLSAAEAGFGACLIDPHGDLARTLLEQLPARNWNKVIVFSPGARDVAVGLDLFDSSRMVPRSLVVSGIVEVFRKLWGQTLFGPRSEHVLRNALLLLLSSPGTTLLGLARVLTDEGYRLRLLERERDPIVRSFWLKEFGSYSKQFAAEVVSPVLNKLGALSSPAVRRVVGQNAPRVRLPDVLQGGRLLVADLSGIGRDASELVGGLLVNAVGLAALARSAVPEHERRPFLLVADEFQSYLTLGFTTLLSEGRKFGLSAVLAHQNLGQLDEGLRSAILGNVGTLVSFNLSAEDARILALEFAPEFGAEDLVRLKRYRIVLRLLSHGEPVRPTLCRTLPPPPPNGGPPATLLRISRERYGRKVDVVDRAIAEALGFPPSDNKPS